MLNTHPTPKLFLNNIVVIIENLDFFPQINVFNPKKNLIKKFSLILSCY
jgi:hypothetical protein